MTFWLEGVDEVDDNRIISMEIISVMSRCLWASAKLLATPIIFKSRSITRIIGTSLQSVCPSFQGAGGAGEWGPAMPPWILTDQLTLSKPGGKLCPPS